MFICCIVWSIQGFVPQDSFGCQFVKQAAEFNDLLTFVTCWYLFPYCLIVHCCWGPTTCGRVDSASLHSPFEACNKRKKMTEMSQLSYREKSLADVTDMPRHHVCESRLLRKDWPNVELCCFFFKVDLFILKETCLSRLMSCQHC